MYKYIFKRLFMLIPVIIGVTFLVYFILDFAPGDPVAIILGIEATEEAIQEVRKELGLDKPFIIQYLNYMAKLCRGDLGKSWAKSRDVMGEIITAFPPTITLTFWGMLVAISLALPIGIISAVYQYSIFDNVLMVCALLGISMPSFWLGLLLILTFALNLGWLPSGGVGSWKSFVMPAISLGTSSMATITRLTRSSMLEVIRADYIRTARAKGVAESKVITKHALKNALIPTVTVVGLQFGGMLGGSVMTESVYAWPGVGRLMVQSINKRDIPMVLGCVIMFSLTSSVVNLLVDVLYGFIDPRIKSQYK